MQTASRPPLRRIAAIDQMIRSGEYPNATTVARKLEVHPRTIHRDLDFLRDSLRMSLKFSRAHNGYFYTERDCAFPFYRLTEGEFLAPFPAERLLQEYGHAPYAADLAAVFEKLTAALPDDITIDLTHLREAFWFHHQQQTEGDVEVFRRLTRALKAASWNCCTGRPRVTRCAARVVDPYHLATVMAGGTWWPTVTCARRC